MKTPRFVRLGSALATVASLLALALLAVAPGLATAANLYWSGNGSTLGGAGTWDTTAHWGAAAAGPFGTNWVNANKDTARFAGTAGAVTLGANSDVGGLIFDTTAYPVTTTGFTLNFAATNNLVTFNNTSTAATITGPVGGSGNVILFNAADRFTAATLTLNGTATGGWSGTTTIGSGATLATTSAASLTNQALNNTTGITLNGGTISFTRASNAQLDAINDSAAITVNGGGTFSVTSSGGGASAVENVGGVTVNSGLLNLVQTANNQNIVRLNSFSRGATAALAISANSSAFATAAFTLNGQAATTAGQIIGSWATVGAAANSQADYAVYDNSSRFVNANIAASAESTWPTAATPAATDNYTLASSSAGTGTGLTGTRIMNALRRNGGISATVTSFSGTTVTVNGSAFANGDPVFWNGANNSGNLTRDTLYYVVNASGGTTFSIASAVGGAPITLPGTAGKMDGGGVILSGGTNLYAYGILNASSVCLSIVTNSTGGSVSTPSGGGNLYLNTGSGGIAISAPITDNGGQVTVVRNGSAGYLTLYGNNTFSGGLVVNSGGPNNSVRLFGAQSFTGGIFLNGGGIGDNGVNSSFPVTAAALNGNPITVNGASHLIVNDGDTLATGSTITINAAGVLNLAPANAGNGGGGTVTVPGVVSGTGVLDVNANNVNNKAITVNLTSSANTFTGNVNYDTGNNTQTLNVNSLGDGGKVIFGIAGGSGTFALNSSATAPLTFITRQFEIAGTGGSGKIGNNSAQAFNIYTDLICSGTGSRTLTLGGTGAGVSAFGGAIPNGSLTNLAIAKADSASTWVLSGANTYSGITTISAGTLSVNSMTNVNGGASALGAPTTVANGTIAIGSTANAGTLQYTGSGHTSDRVITLAGTTGGATLDASGTGALVLSSTAPLTATGAGSKTLTLTGNNTDLNTLAGAIVDNGGANLTSLAKSGPGTWLLSGTNAYTGTTTISGGGTLILDYSAQNNQKLANNKALTLSGGTVTLKNGSFTEVASGTTLNAGGTFLTRSGGTAKLRLNAITRAAGGTIDFADAAIADTDTTNTTAGILGGWATLGNDWAVSANGSAADTAVTALSSYTGALPAAGGAATGNYTLTGPANLTGPVAANTLKITGSGSGDTLALGGNDLTITSTSATSLGGLLYVGGGDNIYNVTASGGNGINASAAFDLVINTVTGTLNVSAKINGSNAGRTLVKTGAGKLVVSSGNAYTGNTYVNQGVLVMANATACGTSAGTIYVQNGSAVELSGGISIGAKPINLTGGGVANGGALRSVSGTNIYGGAITVGGGGTRINADSGSLLLLANTITTAFGADLTVGGAGNVTVSNVISGAGSLIKVGAGTLTFAATNTYTGETRVNAGTLWLAGGNTLADGAALRIASGATVKVASGVTETVGALHLDGLPAAAGTWGGLSSPATYKDSTHFSGAGMVTVLSAGSGTLYVIPAATGTMLMVK